MMCNVVIVDDDRIIRRSLSTAIPWEEHGFHLAGEAADGEKGMELIQKTNPQIVISDIKMPYMDGLEMAEKIKETNPHTKVILLTGFEDFSFAQKAISIRAFDYLLKPVDRGQLLGKVKEAWTEWKREQKERQQLDDHLPMRQRQFIRPLLHKKADTAELNNQLKELQLDLQGPYFTVLLVRMDEPGGRHTENSQLKEQIFSAFQAHFTPGIMVEMRTDEFAAILSLPAETEEWSEQVRSFQEKIRQLLHTTVTITAGQVCPSLEHVPDAYSEAAAAMEFRHIVGKDRFFTIENISDSVQEEQPFLQAFTDSRLIENAKMGMVSEVENFFSEERLEQMKRAYLPLQDIQVVSIHLLVTLFQESGEWKKEMTRHVHEINTMQTIQEVYEKLKELFIQTAHASGAHLKKHSVVDKAVAYIEEHFCEEDLTLQKTANYVHMNAAYLSTQFKAEKGVNFVDFLLELRMKKAMQLLRQEQLKIYEVANQVGYSNPQYFSICFKQYTNYSPGQFKKLS
ncbi:response regulator [Domibacillus indicus]|uniref:response regulator n=1 Tax=Domibacillus indicus TaxID=1437523 RepID=UPI000617BAD6|nr:response regulator [Domibacillus indicus]